MSRHIKSSGCNIPKVPTHSSLNSSKSSSHLSHSSGSHRKKYVPSCLIDCSGSPSGEMMHCKRKRAADCREIESSNLAHSSGLHVHAKPPINQDRKFRPDYRAISSPDVDRRKFPTREISKDNAVDIHESVSAYNLQKPSYSSPNSMPFTRIESHHSRKHDSHMSGSNLTDPKTDQFYKYGSKYNSQVHSNLIDCCEHTKSSSKPDSSRRSSDQIEFSNLMTRRKLKHKVERVSKYYSDHNDRGSPNLIYCSESVISAQLSVQTDHSGSEPSYSGPDHTNTFYRSSNPLEHSQSTKLENVKRKSDHSHTYDNIDMYPILKRPRYSDYGLSSDYNWGGSPNLIEHSGLPVRRSPNRINSAGPLLRSTWQSDSSTTTRIFDLQSDDVGMCDPKPISYTQLQSTVSTDNFTSSGSPLLTEMVGPSDNSRFEYSELGMGKKMQLNAEKYKPENKEFTSDTLVSCSGSPIRRKFSQSVYHSGRYGRKSSNLINCSGSSVINESDYDLRCATDCSGRISSNLIHYSGTQSYTQLQNNATYTNINDPDYTGYISSNLNSCSKSSIQISLDHICEYGSGFRNSPIHYSNVSFGSYYNKRYRYEANYRRYSSNLTNCSLSPILKNSSYTRKNCKNSICYPSQSSTDDCKASTAKPDNCTLNENDTHFTPEKQGNRGSVEQKSFTHKRISKPYEYGKKLVQVKQEFARSISKDSIEKRHNRSTSSDFNHSDHYEYSEERSRGSDYDSDREREYHRKDRETSWDERRSISRSPDYSRDREKTRYYRNRDKERDYHRSRNRRSRSGSRWERKSEERKNRDRDRSYRDDDSDSERSPNGAILGASGSEIIGYKSQPPNNTIMIRGLAQHITENDIRQDIILCGLMPKDIRLIRKKDTGASRGFAFVEFTTLAEATRWMDMKQGVLMLQDQYRAIMQYSIPKDLSSGCEKPPSHKASADWFCIKCGAQNFKRRDNCFKCHASRMESEEGGSGSDEICTYATKTIMLRNLDALTTEDSVLNVLKTIVPDLVNSISAVTIGRDPLTSTSRGICYLGLESTIDSLTLYGALSSLSNPLAIDGKTVILSYCKYQMGDSKKAYSEADNVAFPNAAVPSTYSMTDVDSLAEYAANRYAKTPSEYMQYVIYYKEYFTQQISAGNSITLHQDNQMDAANAAAAVAQSAIQQVNASKSMYDSSQRSTPNGIDGKRYPVPDVSKYIVDKTSNYHYDPSTGLYYDPQSTYYWNSMLRIYLYWDPDKHTYMRATSAEDYSSQQYVCPAITGAEPESKKQKLEKQDKVKVAKKIAKDMERWAKTLNQKKELSTSKVTYDIHNTNGSSASADIGFSVLEKKAATNMVSAIYQKEVIEEPVPPSTQGPLVAAYGESESSGEEDHIDEADLLDFSKLICNLCKRQLGSAEALTKHAQLSALHKQNLEAVRKTKKTESGEKIIYRDRAKERRMKYGDPDEPQPSKLKEKYLKSRELAEVPTASSVSEPIGAENVGNRLLQKMGWTEGQGLGKSNQGRTTIIQAEQRSSTVGLGNKSAGYTAVAGESYKDCVKKMMYARYQELTEKENST